MAKAKRNRSVPKWAVDKHPKRKRIIKEIMENVPIRQISEWSGISRAAITRYKDAELLPKVVKAQQIVTQEAQSVAIDTHRRQITDAAELFGIIMDAVDRMRKLGDACDEYLQDPQDPSKYFLGDREEEVWIVGYREDSEGKRYKVKSRLDELLHRIGEEDIVVTSVTSSKTDPRMLLVRASDTLSRQLETLTQAWRTVEEQRTGFTRTEEWSHLVETLRALPDNIKREVVSGLRQNI